jgi:serine/threonine-protein kinase
MDEDRDILDKLAETVADGNSINWDDLEHFPVGDPRRRLLEHLRLVAEIAEQHRSAVDAPIAETEAETGLDTHADPHRTTGSLDGTPGEDLGRWGHLLLRRKIGEGKFGEVFHAHDTWLDHPVALKLLKPVVAERDSSPRILNEARRLARVRHPNVVTVHGADMHDSRLGFWMELIEGDTLSAFVGNGRLSAGEAAQIGQEVCLALAAVHHVDLVHRDVKPQNVMRTSDGGRIILMDLGAGEPIGAPKGPAQGTPLYVAPEIFAGASAGVSTDIYALGVMLFHLVTGHYPVVGSSLEHLIDAHVKGIRKRVRDVRPDLPNTFATAVEQAIHPDPRQRFASAGDFHAALAGSAPRPTVADPATHPLARAFARVAAVVAGLFASTEALGMFASRTFEAVLRVDRDFGAGVSTFFSVGANVLVPFGIVWTLAAAAYLALVALRGVIAPYTGRVGRRSAAWVAGVDPALAAGLLVFAGVVGFLALVWSFVDVYLALEALALDPRPETLDLSILGPAGRDLHREHAGWSVALGFVLGVAIWRWFPRLESRAHDPGRIRALRWAAAVMVALVVMAEAGTRPFLWDDREVVVFKNERLFVIGSNGTELLLYNPAKGERRYARVRLNAPDLRRNVAARALFEQEP